MNHYASCAVYDPVPSKCDCGVASRAQHAECYAKVESLQHQLALVSQERNGYEEAQDRACEERDGFKRDWINEVQTHARTARLAEDLTVQLEAALDALRQVRDGCLFADDDGTIGVSSECQVDAVLFDAICKVLKDVQVNLMSGDEPSARRHRATIKRLEKEVKALRVKAARYDWMEANAKEVYLRPDRVNCEWAPDFRTKWEIPTLICSGPVGGMIPFGDAIDVLRNK